MKESVIIVAGGSGSRMRHTIPKQFIEILGKPLLVHTIEAFLAYDPAISVVLVLPKEHLERWQVIESNFFPQIGIAVAFGGLTRFQSVMAGLRLVDSGLVAIHDAVRPMIDSQTISRSFDVAKENGSGVVMVPLKDSIRQVTASGSVVADRTQYQSVQTPQTFQVELIKKAFEQPEQSMFTDDASVYEAAGMAVHPVVGDYKNIKVTTPEDLIVVEALMLNRK